jgi:imidazolonepropionase-like amidohydrolase
MLLPNALGADYDLAILNGRVIDPETELDAVRNVGIRDGRIAAVTEADISGGRTLDATGLVVAPGFIDLHVHVLDLPFSQKVLLRDGVTTQLDLEGGAYPVNHFYKYMKDRSQANYGATVSTLAIREKVFHPEYESITGFLGTDEERGNCCPARGCAWRRCAGWLQAMCIHITSDSRLSLPTICDRLIKNQIWVGPIRTSLNYRR